MAYCPQPIDTRAVILPPDLLELTETLARNTHDCWARRRMRDGWTVGPHRDDARKTHPNLVPYAQLPEAEKEYDRATAMETLKVILAMGYRIEKDRRGSRTAAGAGAAGAQGRAEA